MRKGGFNMYLAKEKPSTSLYRNYKPKFSKHKDIESKMYIAHIVGNDMSKKMESVVRGMAAMIVQDFLK